MSETAKEPTESVLVIDAPERGRFEISIDGVPIGFTDYTDAAGAARGEGVDETADSAEHRAVERTFVHTEIDEAYGGRGLATILIQTALDSSRTKDLLVIPTCSAVQRFIAKHPDYLDLVPAARRAELGL